MTTRNKVAKSAIMVSMLTVGSKILGFFRETLIAAKFGSSMESDTFFVALAAISLITNLMVNAITTTSIPVLSEIEIREGKSAKIKHTNNMINVMLVASVFLALFVWFASPLMVKLTAKGFEGAQFNLAVNLIRLGAPMILFSSIVGPLTGFLQSEQLHLSSAAIGYPLNIVYIIYLVFLSAKFGIKGLMVAAVLGLASQLLIQLPEARKAGFGFQRVLDIKDSYIRKVLYLSGPVLLGVAVNDIGIIIDKTFASDLVTGSISALSYGSKLNSLVSGIFVVAITTVIFPLLSQESNKGNINAMKKIMGDGVDLILLITIPATVGIIILAKPIVELAFQRGAFTANDTLMTSQALIFYSVGLVASSLRLLITRVYYSLQDTKTPMVNGILNVGIDIVLNIILVKYMAHRGLAFSTSIASIIATLLLFYGLKKKIGSLGTVSYIRTGLKSGLASVLMGVTVYAVYNGLYGMLGISKLYNAIALVAAVILGVVVYALLCCVLKVDQVRELVDRLKERLSR